MGNRAFQDNALFHIFQRLYACSGIIALVRDICHLSLLSRVDDGDTWACERKAQSFCLDNWTPVKITFSLSKPDGHPTEEAVVTVHQFSLA